jgi:hypothetical protein
VNPGDAIELDTQNYRIERAWIVTPEEVSVLDPTPVQSITGSSANHSISLAPLLSATFRAVRAESRDAALR